MTDRTKFLQHPDRLYLDGEWRRPAHDRLLEVTDSGTEECIYRVVDAQAEDVEAAVAAARRAFDRGEWTSLTHARRAGYLRAIARGIASRAEVIADVWTREAGIVHAAALGSVRTFSQVWDYYADLAESFPFIERHPASPVSEAGLLVREPVGVVGAIIPWNSPIHLITYKLAPALLAGCTVIVKASPEAPGCAYLFAEICEEAGIPPGVVNVLTAEREVSELLVRHPDVDKITFTGSTAAGRRIGAICGERVARCTLELGGKSAGLILDDYDLDRAATTIAVGATRTTGQVCASLTRIIVSAHRHDELVERLAARFGAVRVGDPFAPETEMGPLASAAQRGRVETMIGRGLADGARLVTGGARPAHLNRGFFMEPTVFGNVGNDMSIAREEIFGPVLSVIPARDEEDAIAIANDTIYGLNNAVFSNDADRVLAIARRLRSGTVGHNGMRNSFGIAFGGFRQSGIGREGGIEGLLPYLEAKTVILDPA